MPLRSRIIHAPNVAGAASYPAPPSTLPFDGAAHVQPHGAHYS